jgi:hypothetical protein
LRGLSTLPKLPLRNRCNSNTRKRTTTTSKESGSKPQTKDTRIEFGSRHDHKQCRVDHTRDGTACGEQMHRRRHRGGAEQAAERDGEVCA